MIESIDSTALVDVVSRLPSAQEISEGRAPPGHPFFGAMFLFVGSLLVVELLAGRVWRRSLLRRMIWPAVLVLMGLGMFLVTYVQPTEKSLHFTLGVLLLLGGLFEGRYRLGQIPRSAADAFAVPALIVGGFVIGPLHSNGGLLGSAMANTHLAVGAVGWALAAVKLAQVGLRRPVGLEYTFGFGVIALGLSLLFVEQFHHAH